ncbi:MAG: hypothetical protein QM532_01170 [Cyanobium sp. MAG06]|nr:hypothetical protein [Cyanobium sp. MAG06]
MTVEQFDNLANKKANNPEVLHTEHVTEGHRLTEALRQAKASGNKDEINKAQQALDEHYSVNKNKTHFGSEAVDFVPVVGSVKMIAEGLRGKQYGSGKEIKGVNRAIHAVAGAGFLVSDLTGIGAVASIAGKGALKVGVKTMEKRAEQGIEKKVERGLEGGTNNKDIFNKVGKL